MNRRPYAQGAARGRDMLHRMVLSALFLAIGFVLPFLTGQIPTVGNMLLPMHLPVLLCGLICGPIWGAAVGAVLPLIRSLLFGMPPLYPTAVSMAIELAVYGLIVGLIWKVCPKKHGWEVYLALIPAMLTGRVAWGMAQYVLLGLQGGSFTMTAFWMSAFLNAIPGIVLQLVLVPMIMSVVRRHM